MTLTLTTDSSLDGPQQSTPTTPSTTTRSPIRSSHQCHHLKSHFPQYPRRPAPLTPPLQLHRVSLLPSRHHLRNSLPSSNRISRARNISFLSRNSIGSYHRLPPYHYRPRWKSEGIRPVHGRKAPGNRWSHLHLSTGRKKARLLHPSRYHRPLSPSSSLPHRRRGKLPYLISRRMSDRPSEHLMQNGCTSRKSICLVGIPMPVRLAEGSLAAETSR